MEAKGNEMIDWETFKKKYDVLSIPVAGEHATLGLQEAATRSVMGSTNKWGREEIERISWCIQGDHSESSKNTWLMTPGGGRAFLIYSWVAGDVPFKKSFEIIWSWPSVVGKYKVSLLFILTLGWGWSSTQKYYLPFVLLIHFISYWTSLPWQLFKNVLDSNGNS